MDTLSVAEHVEERSRTLRVDLYVRLFCVLAAVLSVAVAGGLLLPKIHDQRKELELVVSEDTFQDLPPGVALPGALLSTFRGLLIHFVWTRSEQLKDEGKYYELLQLHEWLCDLQPRYPKVWEDLAWNMTYNISVGTYSERERWYWVSGGVNLLRDKGIPLNPKSVELYKWLAWTYHHKIGDFLDDHHKAYKRNQAVLMERVLGQPPLESMDEEVIDAFRQVAKAAKEIRSLGSLAERDFLHLYIDRDQNEPSMGEFAARMENLGYYPDADFLEAVARYDRKGLALEDLVADRSGISDQRSGTFRELLADQKLAPARDRLLAAVRAHILKRDLKLDPEYMLELMERFGPLDWRSAYSHALYWAARGAKECEGTIGLDENEEMNIHRYIQFSLKSTCERGRIILEPDFDDPFNSYIDLLPDYRYVDVVHEFYLEDAERVRGDEDPDEYYKEGPAGRLYKAGHVNFLHTAVRELYLTGRISHAEDYYDYLRENYRNPDGSVQDQYLMTLEEFALKDYFEALSSYKRGTVVIHTLLQSCFLNLAYNRPYEAARRFAFARQGYTTYMKDKMEERLGRRRLPPWPLVKAGALEKFLLNYPLPLRMKANVWSLVDHQTKLQSYRNIENKLMLMCQAHQPPFDPSKAFPPPVGLEQYEALREDRAVDDSAMEEVDIDEGSKR